MNDYDIKPNQEIIAIGASNIIGAFFGLVEEQINKSFANTSLHSAYPATGAFSRTAVMARSGAKTPIAGVFTGCIVVLALYVLTPAFYFIPEAVLAAVVVHAVSDLVSGPSYVLELYRTSILELIVFLLGVGITCFVDVETGIYASVGLSLAIMLLRLARPPVLPLGRSPLKSQHYPSPATESIPCPTDQHYIYVDESDPHFTKVLEPLPPGILVMRLTDSVLYPNAGHVAEELTQFGKSRTRNGDRHRDVQSLPWNESLNTSQAHHDQPLLGAIVLDMAAVRSLDATGLMALGCVRTTLERHAGQTVEWHFTGLQNERIRRDLLAFGFGTWDDHQLSAMEISAPSPVNVQQPAGWMTDTSAHTEINMPLAEQQMQQHYHRGSMMMTPGNDEKAIMESWRSAACMELDVHRFSIRNSMYDPMEMDIDPYYASIDLSCDPHDQLPTESYPCFHWDVDTAVRTISDRWHQKKSTQPFFGVD